MNAIILAPGPSLASYIPRDADLIVGVNRAATFQACDAWVAGDTPLIEQIHQKVIGAPLLVTSIETFDTLRDHRALWRGDFQCWTSMLELCPHGLQWTMFSFTAAIVFAAWRGATDIQVFGCDWAGKADFDGELAGKNRSDDRWALERQIAENICEWLKVRGVSVKRKSA